MELFPRVHNVIWEWIKACVLSFDLTWAIMAGVASTCVASGNGMARSMIPDHVWAHMFPEKKKQAEKNVSQMNGRM